MTEISTNNHISDTLRQLSKDQIRFVVALQEYPTKKEAAESIGINPAVTYRWPKLVDEVAQMLALETLMAAKEMRKNALIKAMQVKIDGLECDDERIKQNVATEIIEAELGKAAQSLEVNTKHESTIRLEGLTNDELNILAKVFEETRLD